MLTELYGPEYRSVLQNSVFFPGGSYGPLLPLRASGLYPNYPSGQISMTDTGQDELSYAAGEAGAAGGANTAASEPENLYPWDDYDMTAGEYYELGYMLEGGTACSAEAIMAQERASRIPSDATGVQVEPQVRGHNVLEEASSGKNRVTQDRRHEVGGALGWTLNAGGGAGTGLKHVGGTFRLTNGAYNGSQFSFKIYLSGWAGGSRGRITTLSCLKWGTRLSRGGAVLGLGLGVVNVYNGYQQDGGTFGYNAQVATGETVGGVGGAWAGVEAGAIAGVAVGAFFGGAGAVPGAIVGGAIGGVLGGWAGSELGGAAVDSFY